MLRSWRLALSMLVLGVALASFLALGGSRGTAVAELVLFAVLAFIYSPLLFPRSVSAAEAARREKPVVYWRPGCPYCLRLRFTTFGLAGRASWVNIWRDPEGAAAVRAIAQGNETVPTVVAGGDSRVNPDPRWVRERLRSGTV
ncbi:glutaredoxin domain-containing protein [Kribbella sp. NPDC051952]|uniref:glutaredoxin domain-containing protein n=1 Tax=Kribbella sp. NPDC051952 TaxID=3154851 RepID=UPI00343EABAF